MKTSLQAGSLLLAFSLAAAGAVFAQDVMEPGRTFVTFPGPGGAPCMLPRGTPRER